MCYDKVMYPELFHIGELTVYTYGLMIALGLLGAVGLFRVLSTKFKLSEGTFNFYSTNVLISIILGFLFALLFQAVYDFIDSGFTDFSFGGMTFMGGLVGGVACFLIITAVFAKGKVKTDFWKVANLMAPCIPLAHGFGRIGCFFAGCCYGKASDSFFAIKFPNIPYKVLPTQLFEAIFLFVLFGVLLMLLLRYKRIDLLLLVYLFSYAVFRFIIEYFRGDYRGSFIPGISPSQFQSIIMVIAAAALAVYIFRFDKVPFGGKTVSGSNFKELALNEPEVERESGAAADNQAEPETPLQQEQSAPPSQTVLNLKPDEKEDDAP